MILPPGHPPGFEARLWGQLPLSLRSQIREEAKALAHQLWPLSAGGDPSDDAVWMECHTAYRWGATESLHGMDPRVDVDAYFEAAGRDPDIVHLVAYAGGWHQGRVHRLRLQDHLT